MGAVSDVTVDDTWTKNGLPVRTKNPVVQNMGEYEIQHYDQGGTGRIVLLHRKEMLPYLPVSRKVYLEQCIAYHSNIWNEVIKDLEQMPVRSLEEQEKEKNEMLAKFKKDFGNNPSQLKSAVDYYLSGYQTDQQRRDEELEKIKKIKREELKKFTDEMEQTTKLGLLDSPAMILQLFYADQVFESDRLKARMVVTENPDYIRKDLPKHVPQVFVIRWRCNDWPGQKNVCDIIDQHFPFEKLQAMIDK